MFCTIRVIRCIRIEYFDQFEMADMRDCSDSRSFPVNLPSLRRSACLMPSDTLLFALLRLHGDILPPGLFKQRVTANRLHNNERRSNSMN